MTRCDNGNSTLGGWRIGLLALAAAVLQLGCGGQQVAPPSTGPARSEAAARSASPAGSAHAAATTITPGHSNGGIVIRPDLKDKVKDIKDVKGMKFGICSLNSGCEFLAEQFLAKGGLTPNDVTYVVLGFTDIGPAMANKAIDIGIVIEPLFTAGIAKDLFVPLMHGGDIYPSGYTASVLVYSGKFRTQRKDVAERFTVALVKGMRD